MSSRVVGELRVVNGGAQFYAKELILPDHSRLPISATSSVVRTTEQVRKGANLLEVLAGSVLGAGAAAGVSAVTGDRTITAEEVARRGSCRSAGRDLCGSQRGDFDFNQSRNGFEFDAGYAADDPLRV